MPVMSSVETVHTPAAGEIRQRHDARYAAFLKLQRTAREIRGVAIESDRA